MRTAGEQAAIARGIEQAAAAIAKSNRFNYVDREPIRGTIDGVDFGHNLFCIARSPTAALFWDAGHKFFGGIGRQLTARAHLVAWRRPTDEHRQGHRAYRRIGEDGGRLTHDRLLAVGEAVCELFDSPRDYELMNSVARTAGRPPRTLLIEGGGVPFKVRQIVKPKGKKPMEKRESIVTGQVVHISVGPPERRGWHYIIEGDDTVGPYTSEHLAREALRGAVLGEQAIACPGPSACLARDDETVDGVRPELCATCPDRAKLVARVPPDRRDNSTFTDRRQAAGDHFAGRDRRMTRRPRRMVGADRVAADDDPDLDPVILNAIDKFDGAAAGDHRLDRVDGRNKYAVVNMRQVAELDGAMQNDAIWALNLLRRLGLLNDGDPGSKGEFFVLMLKDEFAAPALLNYSAAARKARMANYADDVLQLSARAGHGSPWCKRPD